LCTRFAKAERWPNRALLAEEAIEAFN